LVGDLFTVESLVGPDADAHIYEPRSGDVRLVKQAKLVVANGLGLEHWLPKLVSSAGYPGEVALVSKGIQTRQLSEDGVILNDPHIWQDVGNAIVICSNIELALEKVDPIHSSSFKSNFLSVRSSLLELDESVKNKIDAVPKSKRRVITTHDAFDYFGERYDVGFIAPEKWSTEAEVSAQNLAILIKQIRLEKTKALFIENMTDPRIMEQISSDVGAFPSPDRLYSDSLSKKEEGVDTYEKMIKHNTDALVKGMLKN
jgi:zinc/manganese transport system substrate-binding protein